jgi:hypothetical protein
MNISAIGKSSTGSAPSTAPTAPAAPSAAPSAAPAGGMRFATSGARRLAPPADNSSRAFEDQPDDFDQRYGITSGDSESSANKSNKPAKPAQDSIESDDVVDDSDETETLSAPKEEFNPSFERETKKDDAEDDEDEIVADEPAENQELPAKRDYTTLDPEIAKIAKKLPNHLYARVVPKLTEYKKLADQVPTLKAEIDNLAKSAPRYLAEHPESFKITPQYQEASQIYNDATAEHDHWVAQLHNIKAGKPWVELLGYGQNGQPITREHQPLADGKLDTSGEIKVMTEISQTTTAKQQAQRQANEVRTNHKNFYDGARRELDAAKTKFFPELTRRDFTSEEKDYVNRVKAIIPQAYRDHPLADIHPLSFLTVRDLATKLAKAEATIKSLKGGHAPASVGPRKAAVGKGSRGSTMIDLNKEFPSSD